MRRTKVIKFNDFVSGEYIVKEKQRKKKIINNTTKIASSALLPIATLGTVGSIGLITSVSSVFANTSVPATVPVTTYAVEATAKEWMSEQTLSTLAHVLDPLVDIMVALSFPIASVIIVGACFFFMFGQSEKGWDSIMKAGLGYVLIQVSPLILDVLKQVGNAV